MTTADRPVGRTGLVARPGEWDNRPLSGKRGERVPRFTFAAADDVLNALARMAWDDKKTMSEWLRDIITDQATARGLLEPPGA